MRRYITFKSAPISQYGETAVDVIQRTVAEYGLPMPRIQVNPTIRAPGFFSPGYRGQYDSGSKTIILSDLGDLDNGHHEALHYVSDMLQGNPLAMFDCQDATCLYHSPKVSYGESYGCCGGYRE